ncbi:MAG: DapH/DapD/GlmU-related protein [Methanoregula sp.]
MIFAGFSYLPGTIKIISYRALGANIGKNVELGMGSIIMPFDGDFKKIQISDGVIIGDDVKILAKYLILGEGSQIKASTRIWGQSSFSLGPLGYIDRECHFDLRKDITLGKETTISGGSWFYTHMVFLSVLDGAPFTLSSIRVGDRTYLGANAFVLPGVTIGHDAVVGARSVVTRDVESNAVVVGNPARQIGKTPERFKKLVFADKELLVKEILDQFIEVYDKNTKVVGDATNKSYRFVHGNHFIYYQSLITDLTMIEDFVKRDQPPNVIISFGISDKIKEYCLRHKIEWIDLESGKHSKKISAAGLTIENFFSNYGIRFQPE